MAKIAIEKCNKNVWEAGTRVVVVVFGTLDAVGFQAQGLFLAQLICCKLQMQLPYFPYCLDIH